MRKSISVGQLLIVGIIILFACIDPAKSGEEMQIGTTDLQGTAYSDVARFKGYSAISAGKRLLFRLYVPEGSQPLQGWPLLLYIHGMGSIGTDNQKPLKLAGGFAHEKFQRRHPCIVLVPQCPEDDRWVKGLDGYLGANAKPYVFSPDPTVSMSLLIRLLEEICSRYPIDQERLYVGGPSMGGFATWDMLCRLPNRFSAAFPICGGADIQFASRLAKTPLWIFHGAKDATVKVDFSRNMVEALRKEGGVPNYTEYPDVRHNAWDFALKDDALFDWLFSQKHHSK